MGTLVQRKKTWRYSARKVIAFGLLMADIPVYVSCKFEMYIFKIALVISENVCIAFLFVLSICCGCSLESPRLDDSNEHPQHSFFLRNKQNYHLIIIKYAPYFFC